MTEKSPEFLIDNATYFKSDELLRYLHILDTLAYESLAAQLKYFEKEINNNSPSIIKQLKWIATKKYMCFFEVKKSLLKSSDFIDINKFAISNKNDLYNIIRRPNITQFFNLLFANFDPTVPDLQNVDIKSFFSYVIPPSLMQSEAIWVLDLNLRVQIYISKINKNPQRNLYKTMFPNVDGEDGPPMYKETYKKFCNIIQRSPDDVEMLTKEFKWSKFVQDMFKCLSNIFNRVNESEMPLLYKYPSIEALPILSSSSSSSNSSARVVIIEDIPREDVDNSAKKRRLADTEENDDDISSDNIDDNIGDNLVDSSSISKKEEIEQITSQNNSQSVELIVDTELKRTQSDLLPNSDGESLSSTLIPRTPRSERRSERDNKANSNERRATLSTRKTMERSSSSLTNMIVDQPESVDDRQSSSDESFTEGSPPYEQNEVSSRNKLGKRKAIDNADYADNDETRRMTKRIKVMWTDRELFALEEGMRQHGKQWTTIKKNYGEKGQILENRSAAKLKDKARCEYHRRQRDGIEAGVFGIMDGQ